MRGSEEGKGYVKFILALLVLGVVGFVSYRVGKVYFANYELQDYIRQAAIQYSARPNSTPQTIANDVLSKAQDLGLPITSDNIKVRAGNRVVIDVDYQAPVDLVMYTVVLHFTPSSEAVL